MVRSGFVSVELWIQPELWQNWQETEGLLLWLKMYELTSDVTIALLNALVRFW
jgi:hypothetical protein